MQKLPERAGSARSRANMVPIPRVEGVEAAHNRDFDDLDVFWSAGEDLVSAKSSSSCRHFVPNRCAFVLKKCTGPRVSTRQRRTGTMSRAECGSRTFEL